MDKLGNMTEAVQIARLLREKLLDDPHRPCWHFAVPGDIGMPGDPNGAFYARGRYHLMYLYHCKSDNFRYGHISSADLIHWRHHRDSVCPDELDGGIFSGGAFLDDDGTAYMTYWSLPVGEGEGGIRIAKSNDPMYEKWEKYPEFAVSCTSSGIFEQETPEGNKYRCCSDPSNIWKKDGKYYMQAGNLPILNLYKNDPNAPPELRGDWVDLFESDDMISWRYVKRFYERDPSGKWTDDTEDDMCPSFLPLPAKKDGGPDSGKYLQLFIAHNKGCQYYTGEYDRDNDSFIPEEHGRMSWGDNFFFAPEALIDGRGRQIMWSWLLDEKDVDVNNGWSGLFGLPRVLWYDGGLRMAPADELKTLRCNRQDFAPSTLENSRRKINGFDGDCCEIKFTADVRGGRAGISVYESDDRSEAVDIYYDPDACELVMDTTKITGRGRPICEHAPFKLEAGEKLELTVYIDKSIVEVFVNERQAISRRVFAAQASRGVSLFSDGGASFENITAWDMSPSNMY